MSTGELNSGLNSSTLKFKRENNELFDPINFIFRGQLTGGTGNSGVNGIYRDEHGDKIPWCYYWIITGSKFLGI